MTIAYSLIDIQKETDDEIQEIVSFHNSAYGTARTAMQWRWQYQGVEGDKAVFAVARDNGKLIGTQGMMPYYLNVCGVKMLTGKSENTLLHPEYRGKGVMPELYQFALQHCQKRELALIWGFTHAAKPFQKYGFNVFDVRCDLGRPGFHITPHFLARGAAQAGTNRTPKQRIALWWKYGAYFLRGLRFLVAPQVKGPAGYNVSQHPLTATDLKDFRGKRSQKNVSLVLDDAYMTWRMREHPFFHYQDYQVRQGGALTAYAFVVENENTLYVSDWASLDDKSTRLLISRIVQAYQNKVAHFNMISNSAQMDVLTMEILRKLGFRRHSGTNLVVKDLTGNLTETVQHPERWDFSGLWTEGYTM